MPNINRFHIQSIAGNIGQHWLLTCADVSTLLFLYQQATGNICSCGKAHTRPCMEGRPPSTTGTPAATPWTEQQLQEHYTIAPPITNQPGGIHVLTPRTGTSPFDFNMQMLASAAQMRGVNAAGPTLPYQFDSRVGTNRVMDLPEPVSPHINANATDATDSPLSASTPASTSVTGAMTSAGLDTMKTTESVTAADSTNIIDGVKRRSATKRLGAHGLPPPTPHSTGSERSATMSDQAEGGAATAQGPAQIAETRQKGHCKATPKHLLSQNPKAIASRARRAAESRRAGKKQNHLPSSSATTSATPVNLEMRDLVSSTVTQALSDRAEPFRAVTPTKRAAACNTEDEESVSLTAKRPRTTPRGQISNDQYVRQQIPLESTAAPLPLSPANAVFHPSTGRAVSAKSVADIAMYSQGSEDLDWTKCKDAAERQKLQRIIAGRKRRGPEADRASKKVRISETEALASTREICKSTESRSLRSRERIVHEGDDRDGVESAEETGDLIERNRALAEPARAASSGRYTAQSLADIAKYSRGEDLDWTKIDDPVERKAVRHIVSDRKRLDPDAVRSRPISDRDALAIAKKRTVAHSVTIASTVPDARADDDTQSKSDQHSEDEDEDHNSALDDQALAKPVSRSIVTARPLSAQSSADIVKYSLAGEDLDWSKCHNISERKRMQNLIHRRKCDDKKAKKANKTRKAKPIIPGDGTLKAVEPIEDADTVQVAHEEGEDEDAEDAGIEDEEADVAVAEDEQAENQEAEYEEVEDQEAEDQEAEVEEAANENEEADVAAPEDDEADVEEVVNDNGRIGNTAYNTPNPESLRSDEVQTIDFVGGTFSEQEYVQDLRAILDRICKSKSNAFYTRQCRRIGALLAVASSPKSGEMLIKTTSEQAAKVVETNFYFPGPLVTYGQQPMPLQTQHQFFGEYYDETVQVHVQDPSARVAKYEPRVRIVNIATVKARFSQPVIGTPWNVLELAAHCDDGIRPAFLNNEDCTLLTKLKLPCTGETASRLGFTEGFQEVEKWVLAAQAGALTEPHQDSHGYSTYITVNQGYVGFGWLSNPTDDERAAWSNAHDTYTGGRWRYVILRPGTTVYFPAGTIHFVFRHPAAGNTLAFGGHVLRCSQIVRWIKVLRAEQVNGNITNEDLSVSAPRYLDRVENFVKQAQKSGKEEMWGGKGAIEEFLMLKQVFDAQAARNEKRLKKAGRRA
ncbi:hypothetical protein LTR02_001420 [Friedmanniomyces endolithicus]|nr:hypothetical protein LTR94_003176 [Friedmanniomyces endolithicus]KAK0813764.1 hypothetical protein LTR59_000919 [Friedmanniomyces endolithicus]KAK0814802.1 hypothetical protein LTR38_002632 [Friedmanniomyces endolithicus]KAK0869814.1 hypothetical protein LTS02_002860 [Friedmanniomyces endolithicus]KAK0915069.1 hypothetical protein LTR02_001420 [Friedmanniomyces endolithicus]